MLAALHQCIKSKRAADTSDTLAEDVVAQIAATYAFKASVLTLKTQDRMVGSLLDTKA